MKFLFDLLPVIFFFAAFKFGERDPTTAASLLGSLAAVGSITPDQAPILLATAVAIVATIGQVMWLLMRGRKVDHMLWASLGIIVVFGGATILLHDETFIKWKPTVLYWLFAAVLLASAALWRKNLVRSIMEPQLSLPEPVWSRLNTAWIGFFSLMGVLNLFVAFSFPIDVWVNFKLFGGMGLMLAFVLGQGVFLSRYLEEKQ
ncbi:MAG: septation protein A [Betaproteobacteria bacterium]|nr:septation protein A [Betaproteobacteria bacterium]